MEYSTISDCGLKRSMNEDYCHAQTIEKNGAKTGFFIVADGMGGHNRGEIASKTAVQEMKKYIEDHLKESNIDTGNIKLLISRAFYEANNKVYSLAVSNKEYIGMGTTLIASVIAEKEIIIGNVGDSRAYIYSNGDLRQITTDNSYVEELVSRGFINREQAKNHPKRNMITRAIGTDETVKVDFYHEEISCGDYMLLCTDGLTNMVSDFEIKSILEKYSNTTDCCKQLVKRANEKGGTDNITAICIALSENKKA